MIIFWSTQNALDQRLLIRELNGRSTAYEYDNLGRLTKETITDATNGNRTTSYTYDKVGNRLTEVVDGVTTTSVYDNNDRITSAGATTYTYDANGSTLVVNNGGVATSYSYNAKNQLASTTNAQGVTQYAYNIDGIRISQSLGTTNTVYVVDSNRDYAQVLNEITGNTSIFYTYGDDLISQKKAGQTAYYHYDGLGSTRQLSNTQGNFTDGYHYQAFGKLLNKTGTTDNKYLFTGEQYDNNLNQYYLRARYYNQNNGRFTQMDTYAGNSQDPATLHKYVYANADGVNKIDPSGNMTLGETMSAINTTANMVNNAISVYNVLLGAPEDAEFNGLPTLEEYLLSSIVKSAAYAIDVEGTSLADTTYTLSGRGEAHHVIPVYCCGHRAQTMMPRLTVADHRRLHKDLYLFKTAVNISGKLISLAFEKPKNRSVKTPVQKLGRTKMGRTAIESGLNLFYAKEDWLYKGSPTILASMIHEGPKFIAGHSSYSKNPLSSCVR